MELTEKKLVEIREKRYAVIKAIWELLVENNQIDPKRFKLSRPLVEEVIEHYIDDWWIIKARYKIQHEIQLHKIAGLMTAAILRYRPIIPLEDKLQNKKEIYINEFFAVLHGLAICGEYSLETCQAIAQEDWFNAWFDDFLHLIHRRNYTAEGLSFIYQTLSIFVFPKNLNLS